MVVKEDSVGYKKSWGSINLGGGKAKILKIFFVKKESTSIEE